MQAILVLVIALLALFGAFAWHKSHARKQELADRKYFGSLGERS